VVQLSAVPDVKEYQSYLGYQNDYRLASQSENIFFHVLKKAMSLNFDQMFTSVNPVRIYATCGYQSGWVPLATWFKYWWKKTSVALW